jgi:hypothetical protein
MTNLDESHWLKEYLQQFGGNCPRCRKPLDPNLPHCPYCRAVPSLGLASTPSYRALWCTALAAAATYTSLAILLAIILYLQPQIRVSSHSAFVTASNILIAIGFLAAFATLVLLTRRARFYLLTPATQCLIALGSCAVNTGALITLALLLRR